MEAAGRTKARSTLQASTIACAARVICSMMTVAPVFQKISFTASRKTRSLRIGRWVAKTYKVPPRVVTLLHCRDGIDHPILSNRHGLGIERSLAVFKLQDPVVN